jgi:hypothetical protein
MQKKEQSTDPDTQNIKELYNDTTKYDKGGLMLVQLDRIGDDVTKSSLINRFESMKSSKTFIESVLSSVDYKMSNMDELYAGYVSSSYQYIDTVVKAHRSEMHIQQYTVNYGLRLPPLYNVYIPQNTPGYIYNLVYN